MENSKNCETKVDESVQLPMELKSTDVMDYTENWRNCPSPDSPRKPVKSTAVVKYSTVHSHANFALLQCNTDLNLPPSNWLSSSADSYGLQHVPSHSTGFSSFRMAHMFPECVGEVDVVSDAENIKKLLKIPYSRGPVSMMVHRIENTLLIDEFDIHKHLLRTAESEWEWLKKFFFDHVLQSLNEKERSVFHKNNSRCALQQKSLVSKFLYHSLAVAEPQVSQDKRPDDIQRIEPSVSVPVPAAEPPLPEPTLEEELPDPASNHKFARNVVWTFEDIQMLIGTNLPIFGGSTHPCISLKLRDVSKPINVLTGIDYWLDNLMCNVPELVMCYHLDGIVQKYELIKTEDLPHLENSKFSPKVIRDVAQNILSFLKSNATKAGHTYWLFKGKDAEVVKLYDLTSLCTDVMDEKGQNPFTVPVAMLLYRVARNMKHSPDGQRQQGTIRMLLKNCIALLTREKYPQIVTSAHYMLSDLYIPADTDPASPNLSETLEEEPGVDYEGEGDEGEEESTLGSSSVAIKSLCLATPPSGAGDSEPPPPPVAGGVPERCQSALQHVSAGLSCLQYFDCSTGQTQGQGKEQATHFMGNMHKDKQCESENPKMARPFEAIPMPYTSLNNDSKVDDALHSVATASSTSNRQKKKESHHFVADANTKRPLNDAATKEKLSPKALLCKYRAEAMPTWQQSESGDNVFWKGHLKNLLYEKACLVYATLAESEYVAGAYGSALRCINSVLRCQNVLEVLTGSAPNVGLQSYLLGRAGDLCFMLVQDWVSVEEHRHGYTNPSDVEQEVEQEIQSDATGISNTYTGLIPASFESLEQMLMASCSCYRRALELEPLEQQRSNLLRRLGNIQNELGVLYMNHAAAHYQKEVLKPVNKTSALQTLFTTSLNHLEAGVQAFEAVKDDANLALLHSNTGRLMRMCAHYHSPAHRAELTSQERHFYNKALSSYQKAIQVLGNRRNNPVIWDTVTWELSTTLFTMATLLQDFPLISVKSQDEAEREVVEHFLKALKFCDLGTPGPRQLVYQFRAASIHHRLASLYHKSYRCTSVDDPKRKNVLQLCRLHYEKASRLLLLLEHPSDYLRVQMERVALAEFQAQNAPSFNGKMKALQSALELLLQCRPILKVMEERTRALRVRPDMQVSPVSRGSPKHSKKERKGSVSSSMVNAPQVNQEDSKAGTKGGDSEETCDIPRDFQGQLNCECALGNKSYDNQDSLVDEHLCSSRKSSEREKMKTSSLHGQEHHKGDGLKQKEKGRMKCEVPRRVEGEQVRTKSEEHDEEQDEDATEEEEEYSMIQLLEQRLQFALLSIVKLYHGKGNLPKKESDNSTAVYKRLYSLALRKGETSCGLASHLLDVLTQIEEQLPTLQTTGSKIR